MMGRYPNKAPLGFINCTAFDGKKEIVHVQPAADIIKWAFKQLAKNSFTIETVRRMAFAKGLKSSRSAFWKLVRNPVYCGLTTVDINKAVIYLICIGMIEVREDNAIRINKKGKEALADCRFQQLASTTFFNYTSMKTNQLGIVCALASLAVALAALIITV